MDEFYLEASTENGIIKTESSIVSSIAGGPEDDIIINGDSYSFINRPYWQAGQCNRAEVNEGNEFFPIVKKNGKLYILKWQYPWERKNPSDIGRISTNKIKYRVEEGNLQFNVFDNGEWSKWRNVTWSDSSFSLPEDWLLNPNPS